MSAIVPRLKALWHGPANAHHLQILRDFRNRKLKRPELIFSAMTRNETTCKWADYFITQVVDHPELKTNPRKMERLIRILPYTPDATNYLKLVQKIKEREARIKSTAT